MTSDSFYTKNAAKFFSATAHIDMSQLYDQFLPLIPKGGAILDAGCGSGRDALAFKLRGYKVEAFDVSEPLTALAQVLTGLPIKISTFLTYHAEQPFDGIWACASLLHVPRTELTQTLTHLAQYLSKSGYFYCSFKLGEEDIERDGRHFTNMTEHDLKTALGVTPLQIFKHWQTSDLRPGREHELWLNAILIHKE